MNSIIRSFARSIGADTKLSLCPLTLLQLLEEAALALNVSSQSVNETICKEWVRDARSLFDQLPDSAEEMSALLSSAPETQRVADPPSVPHFDFPAEEIPPLRALLQPPHTDRLASGVLETFERYGYPPSKSPDSLDINLDGCHPITILKLREFLNTLPPPPPIARRSPPKPPPFHPLNPLLYQMAQTPSAQQTQPSLPPYQTSQRFQPSSAFPPQFVSSANYPRHQIPSPFLPMTDFHYPTATFCYNSRRRV